MNKGPLLLAIALLGPAPALAQLQLRTTGRVALGMTDNVDSTAVDRRADGYTELEPGLSLTFGGAHGAHQLQASIALTLFFARFDSNSTVTNRLDWISLFELSEALQLRLTASGSVGQANLATLGRSAGSSGDPGGFTSGSEWFAGGSVAEGLDWELGPDTTLGQTLSFDVFAPFTDAQPQTFDLAAGLGLTQAWESFTLGLQLTQGLAVSTAFTPPADQAAPGSEQPAAPAPRQGRLEVLLTRLTVSDNHQLTRSWWLDLIAGAIRAAQLNNSAAQLYSPTASLGLRFADRGIEANVSFEHTVRQSLFVGEAIMSQEPRLRLRLPIGRARPARWFAEGTLGYDHGQVLDLDGEDDAGTPTSTITGNHLHAALLDLGARWRMSDALEWSLRYQFSRQWIVGDIPAAQSFSRHLVLLATHFGYPPERVRGRTPRERRQMSPADWQQFLDPAAADTVDSGTARRSHRAD